MKPSFEDFGRFFRSCSTDQISLAGKQIAEFRDIHRYDVGFDMKSQ